MPSSRKKMGNRRETAHTGRHPGWLPDLMSEPKEEMVAKNNKSKSLGPDFESGMLVGFADGLSLMHQMLTDAVEFTAPMNPGISAFLRGLTDNMGKDIPDMLKCYHEAKGLSVSLEVTVTSEGRKWN